MSLYDANGTLKYVPLINAADGCSYWRIRKPFEAMGLDLENTKESLEYYLERCKYVVFNRTPGIDIKKFLELKVKLGFKVIIDWDDFWELPHDHLIYRGWMMNNMPQISAEMVRQVADYVTVTTTRLAERLKEFNKNITVIPNAIPLHKGQWEVKDKKYGGEHTSILTKSGKTIDTFGTRFGYVAGSSHLPDVKSIQPIFRRFPTLKFTLCGYNNPEKGKRNVWDQMESICSFGYHNENYRRIKTQDFENYGYSYDQLDVAIAPLKDNQFNKYKSSLKAYEAGAKKVALICSDTPPYSDDVPRDCATFCTRMDDWAEAIRKHKDLEYVKDQAAKLHEWVKENRDLDKVSKTRLEFYNSLP